MVKKREKPSETLLRRLRDELLLKIPPTASIHRTRAGKHQMAAGSWLWWVDENPSIGSYCRVTDLIKTPILTADIVWSGGYPSVQIGVSIEIGKEEDCRCRRKTSS